MDQQPAGNSKLADGILLKTYPNEGVKDATGEFQHLNRQLPLSIQCNHLEPWYHSIQPVKCGGSPKPWFFWGSKNNPLTFLKTDSFLQTNPSVHLILLRVSTVDRLVSPSEAHSTKRPMASLQVREARLLSCSASLACQSSISQKKQVNNNTGLVGSNCSLENLLIFSFGNH